MANNFNNRVFNEVPPVVSGYELQPEGSHWNLISPEAGTNLIWNPIGANATTYYNTTNASINQTSGASNDPTIQLATRGQYAFGVFSNGGLAAGTVFGAAYAGFDAGGHGTLPAQQDYTFSFDFYSPVNAAFQCYLYQGGIKQTYTFNHPGNTIQRYYFTFFSANFVYNSNLSVFITSTVASSSATSSFFFGAVQLEPNNYGTTYIDGNQTGCSWSGAANNSPSTRSASAAGGRVFNFFKDFGFRILQQTGAGMSPAENITLPKGVQGGQTLQRKVNRNRTLTLTGVIEGGIQDIQRNRARLEAAITGNNITQDDRPLYLRFQLTDPCGNNLGRAVDIPVSYLTGLEGQTDNLFQDKINLQFVEYAPPSVRGTIPVSVQLNGSLTGNNGTVSNYWLASYNTTSGAAQTIALAGNSQQAYSGCQDTNNNSYFGVYDGTTFRVLKVDYNGNVSSLVSGFNSQVLGLVYGQDNFLYAVGGFTAAAPAVNPYIMKINPTSGAVSSVSSTNAPGQTMRGICAGNGSNLFVVGDGSTATNRALKYTVTTNTWGVLTAGSGINSSCLCCVKGLDGNIYIGGLFTNVDGLAANYIVRYSPATASYSVLGTGMNGAVRSLAVAPNGDIIAGGSFTTAGGVTAKYIARWNGTTWQALASGLNNTVYSVSVDNAGNIYASGQFTATGDGNTAIAYKMAQYTGILSNGAWHSVPMGIVSTTMTDVIYSQILNNVFYFSINGTAAGATWYGPFLTTIGYGGYAGSYPILYIKVAASATGSGRLLQITNFTSGKSLYFNSYVLGANEILTINTDPNNFSITSSYYGNVNNILLPGSDKASFGLIANSRFGNYTNNIIGVAYENSSQFAKWLIYNNIYWSVDQGVYN